MMTANEIRDSFKKFFESKGHVIVPSAPMVIKDDPTLMFTNAGMNQWKDIILGTREPEPRRRADTQKCLRVSGKHNDLEEVGHDTYHHTMFQISITCGSSLFTSSRPGVFAFSSGVRESR